MTIFHADHRQRVNSRSFVNLMRPILAPLRPLLGILVLMSLNHAALGETVDAKQWRIERHEESFSLAGIKELVVSNHHGDIRTRGAVEEKIDFIATVQRHELDPNEPRIEFEIVDEVAYARIYFHSDVKEPVTGTEQFDRRRIDATIFVPPSIALTVDTVKGDIQVKGHSALVTATSVKGKISITSSASINAKSERGGVSAVFRDPSWHGTSSIETLTGDVAVMFLDDAVFGVEIETPGAISTDYSIAIDTIDGGPLKKARIQHGEGGASLGITSAAGSVRIRRQYSLKSVVTNPSAAE